MEIKPRILLFDLETMPDLKEIMRVLPQLGAWPGRTLKSDLNSIICFGYKWFDEPDTHCINAWDFPEWNDEVNNDKPLLIKSLEILKEADVIVTHNGKQFDEKVFKTRLYINDLGFMPKIIHIDTKQIAKNNLFLFSNSLNNVARSSNIQKMENGGWSLWEKVRNREQESMDLMTSYCKQDVNVLYEVFKKMLPFVSQMPNYNILRRDGVEVCRNCGGFHLNKERDRVHKNHIARQFKCVDCGTYSTTKLPKLNNNTNYPK